MKRSALLVLIPVSILIPGATPSSASVRGELQVGARTIALSGLDSDRALVLAPELRLGNDRLFLRGSGRVRASGEGGWDEEGWMCLGVRRPLSSVLAFEIEADGGTRRYPGRPRSEHYTAVGRFRVALGRASVFAGGGALRARNDALWTTFGILASGAALEFGRFELGFDQRTTRRTVMTTRDSLVLLPDSTYQTRVVDSGLRRTSHTDAGLHLGWQHGRWSSEARVGLRFGDFGADSRVWGMVSGSYRLTRTLALTMNAGREPSVPEEGIPAGNVASLGLRVSLAPAARAAPRPPPPPDEGKVSLQEPAEGRVLLSIRLPEASRVEIMGDFTDWLPVGLSREAGGRWSALFPLTPGTYRLCMRIDGSAWFAPPGLTEVRDDFGGTVGILVVR